MLLFYLLLSCTPENYSTRTGSGYVSNTVPTTDSTKVEYSSERMIVLSFWIGWTDYRHKNATKYWEDFSSAVIHCNRYGKNTYHYLNYLSGTTRDMTKYICAKNFEESYNIARSSEGIFMINFNDLNGINYFDPNKSKNILQTSLSEEIDKIQKEENLERASIECEEIGYKKGSSKYLNCVQELSE